MFRTEIKEVGGQQTPILIRQQYYGHFGENQNRHNNYAGLKLTPFDLLPPFQLSREVSRKSFSSGQCGAASKSGNRGGFRLPPNTPLSLPQNRSTILTYFGMMPLSGRELALIDQDIQKLTLSGSAPNYNRAYKAAPDDSIGGK